MNLEQKYFDRLPQKTLNKLRKASYRAVDLIELFFPNPDDYTKKVILDPFQKDFIDTIQFGFPLSQFRFNEVTEPIDGVITIWRRQVGKSWSCGYACAGLMILGATTLGHPPTRCGIIAASEEEAQILIEKVKICYEESDFNEFVTGKPKLDKIKLINGSFTKSHTCSHKSIRGPSYHYCFIDEGAQMEEKILFSAAIPTTEHGERWIVITTPQGSKGKLIEMFIKAVGSRPIVCKKCGASYPQVHFPLAKFPVKNQIWEMPKLPNCEHCDDNDYKYGLGTWATPWLDPWKTTVINQAKLKRQLDAHGWSPWARQEWLGEILDEASMVILDEWIQKNTNLTLRNTMELDYKAKYVLGLDYGRLHDSSSFCVTHWDKRLQKIIVDYLRTVSGEFDFDTDYDAIAGHLQEIVTFYKPVWVVPDSTGTGYPEVERLAKEVKYWSPYSKIFSNKKFTARTPMNERRLGFQILKNTKPDLIGNLITKLSMNPPQLEMPPRTEPEFDELCKELLNFECEVLDGGYIKYGTQSYHDDRLIALALSLWAHRKPPIPKAKPRGIEYDILKEKYNRAKRKRVRRYALIEESL